VVFSRRSGGTGPVIERALGGPRVLVVDDDPIVAETLGDFLATEGHRSATATGAAEAMAILAVAERSGDPSEAIGLVLTDLNMPGIDGRELLRRIRQSHPSVVVIVVTGYGSLETAVSAVKQGAFDYLTKPIIDQEMREAVGKALRHHSLLVENDRLKRRYVGSELIGAHEKMRRLEELIQVVAPTTATVLVGGESGTGKSLAAGALHRQSGRSGPLVTFSCGSVPETLMASELFGHVRGAFTGAISNKTGKIAAAEGGTLFIDEINTATPALQVRLLRVLQEKIYEPVGSNRPKRADVRFVLASNEPLEDLVAEGRFRADLFYRINVIHLQIPPLRDRRGDIAALAEHFVHRFAREMNRAVTGFSPEALKLLCRADWAGNVRELENAIQHAVVLGRRPLIEPEDLPASIRAEAGEVEPLGTGGWVAPPWKPQSLKSALAPPERLILVSALEANNWNRQKTAAQLGMDRTTLYKKIRRYGLDRPL
jgi:DNA-binding NtrC family response regulator